MTVRSSALVGALFVLSLATTAAADPDAAKSFDEGLAHYRRQEFGEAALAFFRAYTSSPTADAIYNAGLAWELAGEAGRAATAYELAGTLNLDSKTRDDVRTRLGRLAPTLGRAEVSAPDGATVHSEPFVLKSSKAVIYFSPGRHRVRVTLSEGRQILKSVLAAAGETTVLLVESSTSSDQDLPEEEPAVAPLKPAPRADHASTPWTALGWVSIAVAAVAAGGALYFGVEAVHAKNEFDDSSHKNAAARERAVRNMHWTNICWATAAITGAGGVALLVLAPSDGQGSSALSPRLMVRGRF